MWALSACGAWPPNDIKKNPHPRNVTASFAGHEDPSVAEHLVARAALGEPVLADEAERERVDGGDIHSRGGRLDDQDGQHLGTMATEQ